MINKVWKTKVVIEIGNYDADENSTIEIKGFNVLNHKIQKRIIELLQDEKRTMKEII